MELELHKDRCKTPKKWIPKDKEPLSEGRFGCGVGEIMLQLGV